MNWLEYERKKKFLSKILTPKEYEMEIKKILQELEVKMTTNQIYKNMLIAVENKLIDIIAETETIETLNFYTMYEVENFFPNKTSQFLEDKQSRLISLTSVVNEKIIAIEKKLEQFRKEVRALHETKNNE